MNYPSCNPQQALGSPRQAPLEPELIITWLDSIEDLLVTAAASNQRQAAKLISSASNQLAELTQLLEQGDPEK